MVPSKRFQPVQRVTASREQRAARAFGSSRRVAREQKQKLEELKGFHREYQRQFEGTAGDGISVARMQEYRAFLGRLERAIREQERVVAGSLEACDVRRQEWQQRHMRTQVMDKVMDRLRATEQRMQESSEQKETDDHNQRRGGRRPPG